MNPANLFRKCVLHLIKENQIKQSVIADDLGFKRPNFNSYLKGERGFSEEKRILIADYFKKSYIEMLTIGDQLRTGKESKKIESTKIISDIVSKLEKTSYEDLKLMKNLVNRLPIKK